jgi:uncharacterized protein (DUF427 family)
MEQRTPSGVVPVSPGRGQESVWSYPRPPRIESVPERIRVIVDGRVLADTTRDQRVLETTHPPVFHLPPDDVDLARLHPADRTTVWEWKGVASHLDDADRGRRIDEVAWTGRDPEPRFEVIRDPLAFHAGRVDEGRVGPDRARPHPGGFDAGWITPRIAGPFEEDPGTTGW